MIISERGDVVPTPTPSSGGAMSSSAPIAVDDSPLSTVGMFVIKAYAFGGLAFMVTVIVAAVCYWLWTVIIKREFADSPPELELHPERMREREKARIARLKRKKEEKLAKRKDREEEIFTPPPVRYEPKDRSRSCSLPAKPGIRKPSMSSTYAPARKSSFSSSPSKAKRVSWASSTSTLQADGKSTEKPLTGKASPAASLKSPILSSEEDLLTIVPKARTSVPRSSISIEERSRRGQEMIAATTPEVAVSWAAPHEQPAGQCNCSESADPFDTSRPGFCEFHRYRD